MALHSVSDDYEFETTLTSLAQRSHSSTYVLLRGQFLADIGTSVAVLRPFFVHLPKGSRLYTDGLANASYRHEITDLAAEYNVNVEFLYPRSTIIPPGQLILEDSQNIPNAPLWDVGDSLEKIAGLSLSELNASPEHALGLDFSLPEDRRR